MPAYIQAQKSHNHGFSKTFNLSTAAVTQDLVVVSTEMSLQHTIRIQRIRITIITGAAQTWTVKDKNGTPVVLSPAMATDVAGSTFTFDYGAQGLAATINKSVELTISAAGAAGIVQIEGFQVRSGTAV
jgi:hypothetical protein